MNANIYKILIPPPADSLAGKKKTRDWLKNEKPLDAVEISRLEETSDEESGMNAF